MQNMSLIHIPLALTMLWPSEGALVTECVKANGISIRIIWNAYMYISWWRVIIQKWWQFTHREKSSQFYWPCSWTDISCISCYVIFHFQVNQNNVDYILRHHVRIQKGAEVIVFNLEFVLFLLLLEIVYKLCDQLVILTWEITLNWSMAIMTKSVYLFWWMNVYCNFWTEYFLISLYC